MKSYEITDARENTHDVEAERFGFSNTGILTFYKKDEIVALFPNFIAMSLLSGGDE